ncbi:lysozyme inhibitor [Ideonella livida]|uniref:Lysozyme inhibitor n=1 Tax=Ideonella livida TaxID=2707176 RepID=A0A7C9TI56_9BURK|nr:lysozyme inhibitor [Ideonella livida]NDY89605.1 lysozyme inhibitor [Ideonella livida]
MKSFLAFACLASVLGLVACSSAPTLPAGFAAGQFGRVNCEDGKTFQARFQEDGSSVRVRALHGSAELARSAQGVYTGEGYRLVTEGADGLALFHHDKVQGRLCQLAR